MILNPTLETIRTYTKNLITSCMKSPNICTKKQTTKRNPKNRENSTWTTGQHKKRKKHEIKN